MTTCSLATAAPSRPLCTDIDALKISLFTNRIDRPKGPSTETNAGPDADPGAAGDVRIHDFPITRWLWRRLRALGRRMRAVQQRRRLAGGTARQLQDLGLRDGDLGRTAHRAFWYM